MSLPGSSVNSVADGDTIISIVVPVLNEAEFIRRCIGDVLAFELPHGVGIEILVLDGGSTDGTRQILHELERQDPRIRLIDNPGRIQSTALNTGIRVAKGEFMLRLDAHSFYPSNYLALCLETARRTGADNVGGV